MNLYEPDWWTSDDLYTDSQKQKHKEIMDSLNVDLDRFKLLQEIAKSCKRYLWWKSEEMKDRQSIETYSLVTEYVFKYGTFKPEEYEEALKSIENEERI